MHSDGRAGRRGVRDANAAEGRGAATKVKHKSKSKVCARPLPKCPVRVIGGNLLSGEKKKNFFIFLTAPQSELRTSRAVRHQRP